jgi:cell division protein ZipA
VSALQWALLLLGVGIAIGLIWTSRREKKALERMNAPAPRPASRDWSASQDALPEAARPAAPAAPRVPGNPSSEAGTSFDEYGVGKPRKAPSVAPRTAPTVSPPPVTAAVPKVPGAVIGLYIAEHEGTNILGPKIHAALRDRGLRFGAKKIYHRMDGEHAIFSVASLVKPGELDPDAAEGFATPGLSVFLQLPGPLNPVAAFQDMLDTAHGLARALNSELYDTEQRAPLTPERERALHQQVEEWARRYTAAGRLAE